MAAAEPDVIVVAPCGYRLEGATQLARQLLVTGNLPEGVPVWAVDADAAFVRPGPRVVDGVEALAHIAHPDAVTLRPGAWQRGFGDRRYDAGAGAGSRRPPSGT